MKILSTFIYKVYFLYSKTINHIFHPDIFDAKSKKEIIDRFHQLFYYSVDIWYKKTTWLGQQAQKCPLDLWIYQEIIYELKTDLIIECGTYHAGSTLYLASICDLLAKGEIVSIDITHHHDRPNHKRIQYLLGSSISDEIVNQIRKMVNNKKMVLVILDSDHHKDHVLKELKIYSEFVTKGSYLIVEDTNLNGNPVSHKFGAGPMEAVGEFLKKNNDFIIDRKREKFYMTFNPGGFLLKK